MKNIIILLILAVAAAFAVWQFWPSSGGEVKISPASEESGKALELVKRIKQIEIDTSFFDDPEFLGLESVPPFSFDGFAKGRPNPFLKITASSPTPTPRATARR